MQHRPEITRHAVAEHLPRKLPGAARELATILLRIWLMFAPAALLADLAFEAAWPAMLLVAVGAVLSGLTLLRLRPRRPRRPPVANLSGASNCVWKMDVEG